MTTEDFSREVGKLVAATEGLLDSLKGLRNDLKTTNGEVHANGRKIAGIDAKIGQMLSELQSLQKSVMHGNGQPSLLDRTAQLGSRVEMAETHITQLSDHFDSQANAFVLSRGQIIAAGITLVATLVAAVISLITSIAANHQ